MAIRPLSSSDANTENNFKINNVYCEAQRSRFVVISVKIKERIKIFPIPWCSFTLFKNNVKLDPILRQPKEFLRRPKTRDKI